MKKPALLMLIGVLLAICVWLVALAIPRHDYFIERVGELQAGSPALSVTATVISESVQLESSTGLRVELRVRRPVTSGKEKLPVLLLVGGHRTGKNAVDLVGTPEGIAFAAIDYPYTGNPHPDGFFESLLAIPEIQRAFIDAPPALVLAQHWLREQTWVDASRIELVGVSLGVPFAAVAGAIDPGFSRVWLLHGGGDNVEWVAHAGRKHVANDTARRLAARTALLLVYGNSFDTIEWIARTAPRPVVMVAACNDDYVPKSAQLPLVDAARSEHAAIIWTMGLHVGPGREAELQHLLDIVLAGVIGDRLPVSVDCNL